jgi:hypothetical protein
MKAWHLNAPDEAMPIVDIKDEHPIARTPLSLGGIRRCHVQVVAFFSSGNRRKQATKQEVARDAAHVGSFFTDRQLPTLN